MDFLIKISSELKLKNEYGDLKYASNANYIISEILTYQRMV